MKPLININHPYAPGSVYWEDTRDADCPIQEAYLLFTGAEVCGLNSLISQDFKIDGFKSVQSLHWHPPRAFKQLNIS